MKKCSVCFTEKELYLFRIIGIKNNGINIYRAECKACQSLKQKKYQSKPENQGKRKKYLSENKDKIKQQKKKYDEDYSIKNREKLLLARLASRAKIKGYEFNLSINDIIIPEKCPIYGIPLFFTKGKMTDNMPSIDRIDNAKGYTKDNIAVISWKANERKGSLTEEELVIFLNYVRRIR